MLKRNRGETFIDFLEDGGYNKFIAHYNIVHRFGYVSRIKKRFTNLSLEEFEAKLIKLQILW